MNQNKKDRVGKLSQVTIQEIDRMLDDAKAPPHRRKDF